MHHSFLKCFTGYCIGSTVEVSRSDVYRSIVVQSLAGQLALLDAGFGLVPATNQDACTATNPSILCYIDLYNRVGQGAIKLEVASVVQGMLVPATRSKMCTGSVPALTCSLLKSMISISSEL